MATTITQTIVKLNVKVLQAPTASQLQQSGAIISVGGTTLATNAYQFCGSDSAVLALLSTTGNFAELTNMATTYFAQGQQNGLYVLELGANTVVVDQVSALSTWLTNNPGVFYAYLTPADWDTDAVNVGSVTITDGGTGFTTAPTVTFSAPTGSNGIQATGTATIDSGGAVIGVVIIDAGAYPGQPAPAVTFETVATPAAATLTDVAGGTLAAVTYYVTVQTTDTAGQISSQSTEASLAVALDYLLVVDSPTGSNLATWSVNVSTSTGTETVQATGLAIGTAWTEPTTGLIAGTTPPAASVSATGTANLVNVLNTVAGNYANDTAQTYFFGTTTASTISQYTTNKSMFCFADSPVAPSTEFSCAFPFYQFVLNNPNAANPLAPMQYRFGFGVTPWPATGHTADINTILTAYGNLITTGSQGGISTAILQKGTFMSGDQMSWWFGMDWFEIQSTLQLAAALINGSNSNPPLVYNQHGINTLQTLAEKIVDTGISFNCLLSGSVAATPFSTYSQQNPSDYKAGIYNGLLATVVGINGFTTITFNIDALQFA